MARHDTALFIRNPSPFCCYSTEIQELVETGGQQEAKSEQCVPLANGSAAARSRTLQLGYRRTKKLLAVQLLNEHSKPEATERYLGMIGNIRANRNLRKEKRRPSR